jgi:extracellular matrix binding protein
VIGKNNQYLKKTKEGTKVETYSIKKFKIGTASVVIGASIFFGAGAVAQASEEVSKNTTTDNSKNEGATLGGAISEKVVGNSVAKETTKEEVAAGVAAKLGIKETEKVAKKELVKTLDKTQLSSFISEIEGKISSGAYVNKTEESVANLVADLNTAKVTLESAKTQEELTKTYQKLVVSVNSKLRNKTVEKKETPVVESTTSKETAGNKEENTEKKVETNSIENTGAKDPRNGKEIAKNTAFRAAVNQDPKVDFTFSIPDEKKIYIYNEEHFSLEIPVYSETGKIRYATIKKGSRQRFPNVAGTDNDLDVEFGFTATVINRDETAGVTSNASQANPAKIVITGRPNDILKNMPQYTKQENQTLNVGTRYVQVVDDQGRENLKKGMDITDPGYFYLVLKSQAKKYALRSQGTDEKISVSSLTSPTAEDLKKIKDSIQLEYSTTNEDARFADKRGTLVEHPEDVIQSVNIVGNNIVITFTDGSTKTKPVSEIVQKNVPPVVNLPYSNEANRNIYIYSGEETDLTFTATDESKIKDLKLRGPGDIN